MLLHSSSVKGSATTPERVKRPSGGEVRLGEGPERHRLSRGHLGGQLDDALEAVADLARGHRPGHDVFAAYQGGAVPPHLVGHLARPVGAGEGEPQPHRRLEGGAAQHEVSAVARQGPARGQRARREVFRDFLRHVQPDFREGAALRYVEVNAGARVLLDGDVDVRHRVAGLEGNGGYNEKREQEEEETEPRFRVHPRLPTVFGAHSAPGFTVMDESATRPVIELPPATRAVAGRV